MSLANPLTIDELMQAARTVTIDSGFAQRVVPLLDLTNLNEDAMANDITALCHDASTALGNTAAVCIYPQFIKQAKQILSDSTIKIATVANFPTGNADLETTLATIQQAIADGAQEIDVVMPYSAYLAGDQNSIVAFTKACKKACGKDIMLKVILEIGALQSFALIQAAGTAVINAGADFIKTSTGKIAVGATLAATVAMLLAIKNAKRPAGFKAAGGIRTAQQAASYLFLIEHILGKQWLTADKTRIGASSLLKELLTPSTITIERR